MMRIFVLGVPHTLTSPEFSTCAFTMKAWNLCRMMTDRGHEVVHYGNEGSHPVCSEHVSIMPHHEWAKLYSYPGDRYYDISVDTPAKKAFHHRFAETMKTEMERRLGPKRDAIICVTWGGAQREAAVPLAERAFVVESGIGYPYSWADFRVFESYAWLHMTMGRNQVGGSKWYWTVIPNAFDPEMFEYKKEKQDYLLYLGRLNTDKGVGLAVDLARRTGHRIYLAGQGDPGPFMDSHVKYVGPVGVDARKDLLANAKALLCPTYYVEPFGGVCVEAQMSGTPVVTSDWGAFPETVLHGVTGYRCRTMEQFEFAARSIDRIRPADCRDWALNFTLERISKMYEEYFKMLLDLAGDGFYTAHPNRAQLDWLTKAYPKNTHHKESE
jgi:glycosyltransferase involved in cell wall biosynthesis